MYHGFHMKYASGFTMFPHVVHFFATQCRTHSVSTWNHRKPLMEADLGNYTGGDSIFGVSSECLLDQSGIYRGPGRYQ